MMSIFGHTKYSDSSLETQYAKQLWEESSLNILVQVHNTVIVKQIIGTFHGNMGRSLFTQSGTLPTLLPSHRNGNLQMHHTYNGGIHCCLGCGVACMQHIWCINLAVLQGKGWFAQQCHTKCFIGECRKSLNIDKSCDNVSPSNSLLVPSICTCIFPSWWCQQGAGYLCQLDVLVCFVIPCSSHMQLFWHGMLVLQMCPATLSLNFGGIEDL